MGNCIFANVVWGWQLLEPGEENPLPQAVDYLTKRTELATRLEAWSEKATVEHGVLLQVKGQDLWPDGWAGFTQLSDLDCMPGAEQELEADDLVELGLILNLCLELKECADSLARYKLAILGLPLELADKLTLFVVGEGDETYRGSGCQDGELLLAVGGFGLHRFCLANPELASKMDAAGADYYQWVT